MNMRTVRFGSWLGLALLLAVAACGGSSSSPDAKDGPKDTTGAAGTGAAGTGAAGSTAGTDGGAAGTGGDAAAGTGAGDGGAADTSADVASEAKPDGTGSADVASEAKPDGTGSDASAEAKPDGTASDASGDAAAQETAADTVPADVGAGDVAADTGAGDAASDAAASEAGACVTGPDAGTALCTLAQMGAQQTTTNDAAGTPPTLAGGTLVDGLYLMTSWIKYGTGAETAAHTIRITNCGKTLEHVVSVQNGPTITVGGGLANDPGKLSLTNACGAVPPSISFPYEVTSTGLKVLSGLGTTKYLETYARQ
jgi:hypothetical protein